MIEAHDLTMKYGELFAVKSLELDLQKGDVFGFIGPNGAGKTTTMKILATLLNPTWGEAYVCGYSIYTNPRDIRRVIGYMPDFFGVYDDMKVIEYLEFFAAAYRIRGAARRKICDDVLDLVELGYKREALSDQPFARHDAAAGTGPRAVARSAGPAVGRAGQRSRSPGAHRNPRTAQALRDTGKTIMVSSHILPELADICNKIGIIERGELIVNADVAEVMRQARRRTVLNISVIGKIAAAAELLAEHETVDTVETRGKVLMVTLVADVDDYSPLATLLVKNGFQLSLFKEEEMNLETAFMTLTKGITS